MKLDPVCIGCLFNQILKAFKLLSPNLTRERIIEAQKKLMNFLVKLDPNDASSPLAGKAVYTIVSETLGIEDPYYDIKIKYNKLALKYYDKAKMLAKSATHQPNDSIANF